MQCHYCDRPAAVTADSGGIRVGLCQSHFRERFDEIAADELDTLKEELDID